MRVGAVDVGTNSVRLLLVETGPAGVVEMERITTVTGLGTGLERTGLLDVSAIDRTVSVIRRYGEFIREAGVDRLRVIATSAVRDAGNPEALLDPAADALGVVPDVISGSEEAGLSFAGATSGWGGGRTIVVDLGGGSTEFVAGSKDVTEAVSVDMGSVRLTDRCLQDRPVNESTLRSAAVEVDASFAPVTIGAADATVIGVADTFTSIAAMTLDLPAYDRERVHHTVVAVDDLAALVSDLAVRSLGELEAIPSLDPARAPVILGGAIVAWRALVHLEAPEVIVSEHDSLDGVVAGLLAD